MNILIDAVRKIGVYVEKMDRHTIRINASAIPGSIFEDYTLRKIRASYYLLGALLGRYKEAAVPSPGGSLDGYRPIDMHIKGFRNLGRT